MQTDDAVPSPHRTENESEPWQSLGVPLIIDEPYVKCWTESVAPGETRASHTHRHPWVTVVLQGASGESLTPDGEVIETGTLKTGQIRFNGPDRLPYTHRLRNTSEQTLVMVAIELRHAQAL